MQLNSSQVFPIGKYKNQVIAEVARIDMGYLLWFQTNTRFDIVDFEAITGMQKPEKVPDQGYSNQPQPQQNSMSDNSSYQAPTQANWEHKRRRVIIDALKAPTEGMFEELNKNEMLYAFYLMRQSYYRRFRSSMLEDVTRTEIVYMQPDRAPAQKEAQAQAEPQREVKPPAAQEFPPVEDDLPF